MLVVRCSHKILPTHIHRLHLPPCFFGMNIQESNAQIEKHVYTHTYILYIYTHINTYIKISTYNPTSMNIYVLKPPATYSIRKKKASNFSTWASKLFIDLSSWGHPLQNWKAIHRGHGSITSWWFLAVSNWKSSP